MAAHSSILAWRSLWTEAPGSLQSVWSQRIGHDRSDLASTHIHKASQRSVWHKVGTQEILLRFPRSLLFLQSTSISPPPP